MTSATLSPWRVAALILKYSGTRKVSLFYLSASNRTPLFTGVQRLGSSQIDVPDDQVSGICSIVVPFPRDWNRDQEPTVDDVPGSPAAVVP